MAGFEEMVARLDAENAADARRRGFVVKVEYDDNGESEFAKVTITGADGSEVVHEFADWVDEAGESVGRQVGSFLGSLYESADYSLEERLGAFGLEWEREQEERGMA